MSAGRKPLYDVKSLEIGQKLRLPNKLKQYRHQYLRNFNRSNEDKSFLLVEEDQKLFIERVA